MTIPTWVRVTGLMLGVGLLLSRSGDLTAALNNYDIAQTPLFMGESEPPLMMMVMSRDEQLFNKAYSDYTDLDDDGILDTTYQDKFDYSGYFDPKLCYGNNTAQFKATGASSGVNGHSCAGSDWSGNFLNWATMSRLDVLRFVLYGGQRSVDDTKTVLERARIPNDLHAWVKVYSGADIGNFTPYSSTQSFCNATLSSGAAPLMQVAAGNWSEWASTASFQCGTNRSGEAKPDAPSAAKNYNVRVEVCDPAAAADRRESFCQKYSDGSTDSYKPVGLLQTFGESGRLRFGMVSGSYSSPRGGGVLRRNVGRLAGNGSTSCAAGDEINLGNGRFCNAKGSSAEGIINSLASFDLTQWNYSNNWNDCNNYSILNRQGFSGNGSLDNPGTGEQKCSAWGNPLAEMYAEALRYIGNAGRTEAFNVSGELTGLPSTVAWLDPYRAPASGGNSYCATCSILVMSSGLPSFDSDEVPDVPQLGSAAAATDALGVAEGIHGGRYMAGRVTATPKGESLNTHEDKCDVWTVSNLSLVRGICPDIPSMEGSYLMSGLAYKAATTDLRPGLQGKPSGYRNTVQTYSVALAENLPKFDIPVGDGKISLSPLCQANNSGDAKINSSGWRSCFLGSVGVGSKVSTVTPNHVYGRPLKYAGDKAVAGSFSLVWEDSLWGNDHDNDVVSMLTYCVGDACNDKTNVPNTTSTKDICWRATDSAVCQAGTLTVGADEVLVRIENLSAYAGNAMLTGFTVSGSDDANNVKRLALRPGNKNGSVLTTTANPDSSWDKPQVLKFRRGAASAGLLESPLWYAAKYGVKEGAQWDSRKPGTPDNYFLARDPTKLKAELERIFKDAAGGDAPVSGGGSGARISTSSFTIAASFELPEGTSDWKGNVQALKIESDGTDGDVIWDAATKLASKSNRNIVFVKSPTLVNADGGIVAVVEAVNFTPENLGDTSGDRRAALGVPVPAPSWLDGKTDDDLVNYLRGQSVAGFRTRASILGDIVNSTTEIVSPLDDYGYGFWAAYSSPGWKDTLGTSYQQYLVSKADRAPMVYVGANDGMLHGFDASSTTSGGNEEFAFIPAGSRANMYELADPAYKHRYFVDGGITTSDVPFSAGGDWRTVLVAATGAGSRSVFGLDVSDPHGFGADDVLWELNGGEEGGLGFVLGKPVIVPIEGSGGQPRWVAMFGNGVNSVDGAPVLYVVDIKTGEVLGRLKPTASGYATRNGLMNIAPVAIHNSDGLVDTVYGGDLHGNLWKFDLSDAVPAQWNIAFGGTPLFTAIVDGARQPITGGIEVSTGAGGGVNLFFGTGRYFAVGDEVGGIGAPVQSLYGIWDDMGTAAVGGRSALVEQTISALGLSSGYSTRGVTHNPVNYATKRGWYVDLKVGSLGAGERFIGSPRLQSGKVIFTTYESGDAVCSSGGGTNWEYALDLLTGGGAMAGVTTTPGGESVCTGDCGALSLNKDGVTSPPVKTTNVFLPKLSGCDPLDPSCTLEELILAEQCTFVLRAVGADPLYLPRPCGRQSWRQVR